MTYVMELKTKVNGITKIVLIPSHGFACKPSELANEIFIRARSQHGISAHSDILSCKQYCSHKVADTIAKSMETKNSHYFRG